ncbi:MAG: D-Ala-D-Ala carboxypeptidase family metallohydrolase [Polyangiaceae bacterium]
MGPESAPSPRDAVVPHASRTSWRGLFSPVPVLLAVIAICCARDAPARALVLARIGVERPIPSLSRFPRIARWADALPGVEVVSLSTRVCALVRFYTSSGSIDGAARADFERIAASGGEPHHLAVRVEQLVLKASYHFHEADVLILSGYRPHASRHGTGDAVDFKLKGVRAATLAAYLRGSPRVGVGVYTHPRTQFVHLDVREKSYHWIDASPPGVKWREAQLRDRSCAKRDETWTPEMDLP